MSNKPQQDRVIGKWLIRAAIVLAFVVVLVIGVGMLLPATFQSSAMIAVTDVTPQQFWALISDPQRCHLSSDPSCVVIPLPDVDGMPAWQEQIRGALIDVRVIEQTPGQRIVWDLADRSGPLSTRWTLTVQTTATGSTMVSIEEAGAVASGSWDTGVYRFLMFAVGGWGPEDYLKRLQVAASSR
ncbi:MAG: hypothetical protein AAF581_04360 [Planctomycetota bacterium]